MLDNPDSNGIYPTTECYDDLEKALSKELVRANALGMWFVFRDILAHSTDIGDDLVAYTMDSLGIGDDEMDLFKEFAEETGVESDQENYERLAGLYREGGK
jgi:hypothetical protein